MFVHGREAYRRNTFLVSYMFEKNFIETMPLWVYGWLSLFSGTFIYNTTLYAGFNVIFTSVPIVWFSVFDWEFDKKAFLKLPSLYYIGLKNVYFKSYVFDRMIKYALIQSTLLLFLSFYIY